MYDFDYKYIKKGVTQTNKKNNNCVFNRNEYTKKKKQKKNAKDQEMKG